MLAFVVFTLVVDQCASIGGLSQITAIKFLKKFIQNIMVPTMLRARGVRGGSERGVKGERGVRGEDEKLYSSIYPCPKGREAT